MSSITGFDICPLCNQPGLHRLPLGSRALTRICTKCRREVLVRLDPRPASPLPWEAPKTKQALGEKQMSTNEAQRARTDRNNNPAAFTTDIAMQAGLVLGKDYVKGDPFPPPSTHYTAKLIGDPIALTIRVIDAIGFRTTVGSGRWTYINMPQFAWNAMSHEMKVRIIADMYKHEGGSELLHLFRHPVVEPVTE